jgi:tetratricopeptide (TPR) repeat protein
LGDYWHWTGQEIEAGHVVDEVLRGDRLSSAARCNALAISGYAAFVSGQLDAGRELQDRMCQLASEEADDALLAEVHLADSRFCMVSGETSRGVRAGHAAVRHARRANDRRLLALSLAELALYPPAELARFETASQRPDELVWLAEAQELAGAASMGYTELWVMSARAIVLESRGRFADAIALYRSVLDLARRFEAPASATLPAINLAARLLRAGSIAEGRTVLLSALHTADRAGHRTWASVALQELGEAEAAVGHWADALAVLVAARVLIERLGITGLYGPGEIALYARLERYVGELLGEREAPIVRARAERMSYRELVAFAVEAAPNAGITGSPGVPDAPADHRLAPPEPTPQGSSAVPEPAEPVVSAGVATPATSGAGAPSSR